ncbi:hypothetical protein HispidOSU_023381, partial [Sigmodon hispidus]
CAHKSQLSRAITFPSRELQFQPQQQEAQSQRPWRRQEHPGLGYPQDPEGEQRYLQRAKQRTRRKKGMSLDRAQ